jgi:DNA polymerase I-like protein with 3'-5' exonuclease and polymerase domains
MDVLSSNGIAVDTDRRAQKLARVRAVMDELRERLRRRGYLVDEPGSGKAMQSILRRFARAHPEVELKMTASGEKYSTAEDDLAGLAAYDEFFADYGKYRAAQKLVTTYLSKMDRPRLHARFGYLLETGRTYCGGGFNLQNLPKEKDQSEAAATIRGAFVPGGEDRVFIDSDYSQIELVTFAYACEHQFGVPSELARRINAGEDIHRLIAATVLGKEVAAVTRPERDSAKPVSFGRPGGMGAPTLQGIARANYGVELSLDEVQQRIDAYHRLCPELDSHLADELDTGQVLADTLHLTPACYDRALGREGGWRGPEDEQPQGWLGGMLLKVLRDPVPLTRTGRPYSQDEIAFFRDRARRLPLKLKPALRAKLEAGTADKGLWEAVRNWAGRRPVFTVTGRLRANATFCSARNCVFQGAAADGAVYGLWLVWRAGHKLVSFIHDQVVVEAPADDRVAQRADEIAGLMCRGMCQVVPGMRVKVETVFTRSLNKDDLDRRYPPAVVTAAGVSPQDGRPHDAAA